MRAQEATYEMLARLRLGLGNGNGQVVFAQRIQDHPGDAVLFRPLPDDDQKFLGLFSEQETLESRLRQAEGARPVVPEPIFVSVTSVRVEYGRINGARACGVQRHQRIR